MNSTQANIDLCGIRNLLESLKGHGFTEKELKKISSRIAVQSGATIIISDRQSAA